VVSLGKKKMTHLDKAIEILRQTDDGNQLSPVDLRLVEVAVNDWLSETGKVAFNQLYDRVQTGYQPAPFHGIENLSIDHDGYVRWRGTVVEHYTLSWAYSDQAKAEALELARRCRQLEAAGRPVNTRTVVWEWPE